MQEFQDTIFSGSSFQDYEHIQHINTPMEEHHRAMKS